MWQVVGFFAFILPPPRVPLSSGSEYLAHGTRQCSTYGVPSLEKRDAEPGEAHCRAPGACALFRGLFSSTPVPNPADAYMPDPSSPPAGLPSSYDDLHAAAVDGVLAAIDAGLKVMEVDFPPIASVNARGDGSAKSDALVAAANADFVSKLALSLNHDSHAVAVIGCGTSSLRALGPDAARLRSGPQAAAGCDVAICVAPADVEQWEAAEALVAQVSNVVIVNGMLNNGRHPHAYYFKPLSAFSAQTGGCVRRYPGAYEVYESGGGQLTEVEVGLVRQGRRALPDTKQAQMVLQNRFGRGGGEPAMFLTRGATDASGRLTARDRLWLVAGPLLACLGMPSTGVAADVASLSARFQGDLRSVGTSDRIGAMTTVDSYAVLSAQRDVRRLLDDEETFRSMVTIGLPTGSLQMPPQILFNLFKRLEGSTRDPGEFMDAAIEYVEYSRDANDLIELARLTRTNGGGPQALQDYLDRAMAAAKGAARALDRMVPLLPST